MASHASNSIHSLENEQDQLQQQWQHALAEHQLEVQIAEL